MTTNRELTRIVSELALEYAGGNQLGMCGIASAALYQAIKIKDCLSEDRPKWRPYFVLGRTEFNTHHCWIELVDRTDEDDFIICDPTFGQFSKDFPKYWYEEETDIHKNFGHWTNVVNLEMFFTWKEEQQPTQERIDWFLDRIYGTESKCGLFGQNILWDSWTKYRQFVNEPWDKSQFYTYRYGG